MASFIAAATKARPMIHDAGRIADVAAVSDAAGAGWGIAGTGENCVEMGDDGFNPRTACQQLGYRGAVHCVPATSWFRFIEIGG